MVYWIPFNNTVFELTYSSEQSHYLEYLSLVQEIINSFEFIEATRISIEELERKEIDNQEDPLVILKRRFAKGEINEEEYQRMRKIIEG